MHEHKINEEGKVVVIVPKFSNQNFARWFIPKRKSTHFNVKLDEIGSESWLAIDGARSVADIASLLEGKFSMPEGESPVRLTKFLTQLYDQRFISFTIIEGEKRF